jgi:hypothetical protein
MSSASEFWTVTDYKGFPAQAMASVRWNMDDGSFHWMKGRVCLQERHDFGERIPRFRFLVEGRRVGADCKTMGDVCFEALRIPVNCSWQSEEAADKATSVVMSKNKLGKIIFLSFPTNKTGIKDIQISMEMSGGHFLLMAVQESDNVRRNMDDAKNKLRNKNPFTGKP